MRNKLLAGLAIGFVALVLTVTGAGQKAILHLISNEETLWQAQAMGYQVAFVQDTGKKVYQTQRNQFLISMADYERDIRRIADGGFNYTRKDSALVRALALFVAGEMSSLRSEMKDKLKSN